MRDKKAAVCLIEWKVEGSVAKGRTMTNRQLRLMLRAFNGECDAAVAKVRYNNVAALEKRMGRAFDAINKLGKSNHCEVVQRYSQLKLDELRCAHEYQEKRQEVKEEQRQIREQMREEERARREIEKAQQEAEKEEAGYDAALEKAREELTVGERSKTSCTRRENRSTAGEIGRGSREQGTYDVTCAIDQVRARLCDIERRIFRRRHTEDRDDETLGSHGPGEGARRCVGAVWLRCSRDDVFGGRAGP